MHFPCQTNFYFYRDTDVLAVTSFLICGKHHFSFVKYYFKIILVVLERMIRNYRSKLLMSI